MQHVACMRVDSSRKERVTISLTTIIIIIITTTIIIIIIRRHPVISLRYESGFTNSLKAKVTGEQMRPRAHVENMIFSRGGKGEGKGIANNKAVGSVISIVRGLDGLVGTVDRLAGTTILFPLAWIIAHLFASRSRS